MFMLWKFYLDIARIVFNHCEEYVLPALLFYLDDVWIIESFLFVMNLHVRILKKAKV